MGVDCTGGAGVDETEFPPQPELDEVSATPALDSTSADESIAAAGAVGCEASTGVRCGAGVAAAVA